MNDDVKRVMHECAVGSMEGRVTFPDIVSRLHAVGCEQYHADLRRQEKTYYTLDGESLVEALLLGDVSPSAMFAGDAVIAAIRSSQAGAISYPEFLRRIVDAGCVGYFVYITGRRAVYMGRQGDMHTEYFPTR